MRIGTVPTTPIHVPTSAQSESLVPITSPNGFTYGMDVNGNTVLCPADYPYDPNIKNCKRDPYQEDQVNACYADGGIWDLGRNGCVLLDGAMNTPATFPIWLLIGGSFLLFILLRGAR